ncbi:MAG: T9SS type A sorting domain-containing protein [Bacteroidales bacterium]|nr:T9SS type A sorting domain-containing protein [Bacteroidales bacterium]
MNALPSGGSGIYSFAWSSNPGTFTSSIQSPVVTPTITTTYTVTVTAGSQTATNNVVVTVSPIPGQAGPITGPAEVCMGDVGVAFSVPVLPNANTYHWTLPNGATILSGTGTNTILVNFHTINAQSGNITVYASNFCGAGILSQPISVIVNPLPTANAGVDQYIINAQTVTLTGTVSGGSGSYSYSWYPSNFVINPDSLVTQTVNITASQTFTLTVTDLVTGCVHSSSMQVIVTGGNLSTTASATPTVVCEGSPVALNALPQGGSGSFSYSWTSVPTGFVDNIKNPTAYPTVTTEYYVIVTDLVTSNMAGYSVLVSVNPLPVAPGNITGDIQVCKNESGVIYTVSPVTNATGYNWSLPTGAILTSGQNTNSITVHYTNSAVSGNITVAATNFCGAGPASPPLSVHVDSLPLVNAGLDTQTPNGSSVTLSGSASGGSGVFSYAWSPSTFFNTPSSPTATTIPLNSSQLFTLSATDLTTGCSNSDQVQVIVTGLQLSVAATADPNPLCESGSSTLFALPTGGTGSYSYSWTANPPPFTSTLQNPVVSPTVTTTYTVSVNDGNDVASYSVTVNVNSLPGSAGQISGPDSVCKGTFYIVYSVNPVPGATFYTWSVPNGATIASGSGTNSIMVNYSPTAQSGQVTVYASNICGNGPTSTMNIVVSNLPVANAGSNLTVSPSGTVTLQGSASGGTGSYNYLWAPSNLLVNNTIQNPTTVPLTNTTTFTLTVTDAITGCESTSSVQVFLTNVPLAAVANAVPAIICQGQQSQILVTPSGGTGSYNYNWSSSPIGFTSTAQNPVVAPTITTTYYVSVTSGPDQIITSSVVTVSPLPPAGGAITGTSTVCQGTTGYIYCVPTIPGATGYIWSLPTGASIVSGFSTNCITVNFGANAASGIIKAKGVNLCGEGTFSPDFFVMVNPAPTVDAGLDFTIYTGFDAQLNGSFAGGTGPFSYNWTPFNYFIPQSMAYDLSTTTINLTNSVTFTLSVLDSATGCVGTDQVNVYVQGGALSISATASPSTICQGGSVQLNALPSGGISSAYQYSWTSTSGFTSNLQNPIDTPDVTTQYVVEVTDGVGTASYSVTVNVNATPITPANITGPLTVCQNVNGVQFSIPPVTYATGYVWTVPNGVDVVSGQGTNSIYANFTSTALSGQITVYAYNNCGIGPMSPPFNLNVNPAPYAYTSANQVIPQNTNTQIFGHAIGGSGSYTYTWTPAPLLQNANDQNPYTQNLQQSAFFNLIVTDNITLCQSQAQVQIIVYLGTLGVSAFSSDYDICQGQTVQLNALPTGGNGAYIYQWTPTTGLSNDSIYNPTATPTVTTEYVVSVISGAETVTASVIVNVTSPPGTTGVITGSSSVCKGETNVVYSIAPVNNAQNYTWNLPFGATIISGQNTNTIMVNFANNATSGNISVYASNACGYSSASPNFYVTVNPLPNVYAGADQYIIANASANLNGLISGGSGFYDFYWSPGNFTTDSTSLNTSTLALTSSKIFTLYATDSITGCYNSDYAKVIVCSGALNVNAFAMPSSICEGDNAHLDALPSGGVCANYVYNWTSTSGFTSSLVNPLITPDVTTTYTVTVNDGSNTATSSVVVYVQPQVQAAGIIHGPQSICQNSGIVTYYIDPVIGAVSYVWTFPNGVNIISGADSNVVQVNFTDTAQSGYINVYGLSFCGFGTASPDLFVNVKPLPGPAGTVVGPTYLSKDNNIVQFSVPLIPGTTTYNWVLPYGAVIIAGYGTNSITVEFTDDAKSGYVYVFGSNPCGTGDESNMHLVTIITSIAELYNLNLKVYPNPTDGSLTVEFNDDIELNFSLKVFDLFGKEVFDSELNQRITHLDFKNLSNGMYYLVLANKQYKIIEKFVIIN